MDSKMNTVTIYEIDGAKYTGGQKIEVKSHRRFLSFVILRVDNQEYSVGSDDLLRAIGHAIGHAPAPEEGPLLKSPVDVINQFAEEQASGKREESTLLLPR
jgi:hypothetical protein